METGARRLLESIRQEIVNEMATNMLPEDTGLPFRIWVSEKSYVPESHVPRLKAHDFKKGVAASISIEDPIRILVGKLPPGTFALISSYIKHNQGLLLALWNEEISHKEYEKRQLHI